MVKLGLDVGEKRIGLAISDVTECVARPFIIIERGPSEVKKISEIVKKYNVDEVVVGLPISLRGQVTAQTRKVKEFIENLRENLNIPVNFWDERLTTKQAERFLKELPLSKRKEKSLRDKLSACLILQSYLNYLRENK